MPLIECTAEDYGDEIRDILNVALVHITAIYDCHSRTPEEMGKWFSVKQEGNSPEYSAVQ